MARRLRTFVAVDVDPFTRDRVAGLQGQLDAAVGGSVKWVEPANLHLTLLFLGEVDEREIPAVCRATEDVCRGHASFPLTVAGVSAFPTVRRPRTLIVPVTEGAAELVALHAALEPALLALGCYRREERGFTPHVTLGRVLRDAPTDLLTAALLKFGPWQGGQSLVREVRVMSSELRREGPEYTVLSRAKLARGPARRADPQ
jgi:2'-5' RNA ligase